MGGVLGNSGWVDPSSLPAPPPRPFIMTPLCPQGKVPLMVESGLGFPPSRPLDKDLPWHAEASSALCPQFCVLTLTLPHTGRLWTSPAPPWGPAAPPLLFLLLKATVLKFP